jgi:hypothetical protein
MSHGVNGSSGIYLLESPQPLANVEEESVSSGDMSTSRCVLSQPAIYLTAAMQRSSSLWAHAHDHVVCRGICFALL